MDIVDQSFKEEQAYLNYRIKQSKRKVEKIKPEGFCHFCFNDIEENKLFCNNHCANMYELTKKFK